MPKNIDEKCKVCRLYKLMGCIGRDDGKKCVDFERCDTKCLSDDSGDNNMDWITTTIKRKWMDLILNEEKHTELKEAKNFWDKRLEKHLGEHHGDLGINFLCGQEHYKYEVRCVYKVIGHPNNIDGNVVDVWYGIKLGERIKERIDDEGVEDESEG